MVILVIPLYAIILLNDIQDLICVNYKERIVGLVSIMMYLSRTDEAGDK